VKSNQALPDPLQVLLNDHTFVRDDGTISTTNPEALRLVLGLRLNSPEQVHFRRMWLEIIAMARQASPKLFETLMGYPDDLPDLSVLHPPGGNELPDGAANSYLAKRTRGELATIY
jgi:hypothetical protein